MIRNYMMMFLFYLGAFTTGFSQEVSGTVVDDNAQPLPGVSVQVEGSEQI